MTIKHRILLGGLMLSTTILFTQSSFAASLQDLLLSQKGVATILQSRVETTQSSWIKMAPHGTTKYSTSPSFWVNKLPTLEDRLHDAYIIIPKLGVVTPIIDIPQVSTDYNQLLQGADIDYNPYLQQGVVHFPNRVGIGGTGNNVFFGHSSYWKQDTGRFKTIFTSLPLLNEGDEIWVFQRKKMGGWDKQIFVVNASYQTTPTDVAVMKSQGKKQITLSTCVPIGTAKDRWIVTAIRK